MTKLVDSANLTEFGTQFLAHLDNRYIETSESENYTQAEKTKLSGIESGAEENVLETVQINGTALSNSSKAVNLTVASGSAAGTIAVAGNDIAVNGFSTLASSVEGKAPLASPAFTGAPTSTTPTAGDDSTKIATTEFVNDAIDAAITNAGIPSSSTITSLGDRLDLVEAAVGAVSGAYVYKGTKATYAALPDGTTGNEREVGDVYNVEAVYNNYPAGTNWAWTGTTWDPLGGSFVIDTMTTAEVTTAINTIFPKS